jgi:hypothetical protein
MEQPGVSDWLEDCERILYANFNASNFYDMLSEFVPDGFSPGTAIAYIEEDIGRGRVVYQAKHPLACWISENAFGEIDTMHEEVYLSNRALRQRFGESLSEDRIKAEKDDPFGMTTIRHVTIPMDTKYLDFKAKDLDSQMPFVSIWYDMVGEYILDVGGYWEFPYVVWRYAKNSGEEYGRGPVMDAIGDILGAIQMTKTRIILGQRVADPTLVVPQELEGSDDTLPGGRIYTTKDSQRIEPVQIGANYPITIDNEKRQEEIINAHFNVDIYLMLQQAQGQMTAREVTERMGEKSAILGPITGRFNTEALGSFIRRTFNILLRGGKLPKAPPAVLENQDQAGLSIEFVGLLAQLQKKYYQGGGVDRAYEYANATAQLFPEAMDHIDGSELLRNALEAAYAPAKAIRDRQEVEQIRAARAQAMEQQKQDEQKMAIMQNADKLGSKPEEGSPMSDMAQAMAQQGAPQGAPV